MRRWAGRVVVLSEPASLGLLLAWAERVEHPWSTFHVKHGAVSLPCWLSVLQAKHQLGAPAQAVVSPADRGWDAQSTYC